MPDGESACLADALRRQEYPRDVLADGVRELAPLIADTLNAVLPTRDGQAGVRLCDVPASARIAELEFHFTLRDADVQALLDLLHAHGLVRERRDFGASPRLSGLMNGKIDLTCQLDGRLYVARLQVQSPARLWRRRHCAQAMDASEYDLQALLYVVALHRWLRLRLGDAYDYARDFGGVRYLFCRGLSAAEPGRGVATLDFDRALVEGVDALFAPAEATACTAAARPGGVMTARDGGLRPHRPRASPTSCADSIPTTDPLVLDAAALASFAVACGDAAFDLRAVRPDRRRSVSARLRDAAGTRCARRAGCARPALDESADPAAPLVLEDGLLYLRRYREYEFRLAAHLRRIAAHAAPPAGLDNIAPVFAALFPDARAGDVQARAAALALVRSLLFVTGGPGTGKTTTVARMLLLLVAQAQQAGEPLPRIALAAPTGRAAARMADSAARAPRCNCATSTASTRPGATRLPPAARTLHRLLGTIPGAPQFRHDADDPLALRRRRRRRGIDGRPAVDVQAGEAVADGARLLLLGDRDQLPSVEAGDVLAAMSDAARRRAMPACPPSTRAGARAAAGRDRRGAGGPGARGPSRAPATRLSPGRLARAGAAWPSGARRRRGRRARTAARRRRWRASFPCRPRRSIGGRDASTLLDAWRAIADRGRSRRRRCAGGTRAPADRAARRPAGREHVECAHRGSARRRAPRALLPRAPAAGQRERLPPSPVQWRHRRVLCATRMATIAAWFADGSDDGVRRCIRPHCPRTTARSQ